MRKVQWFGIALGVTLLATAGSSAASASRTREVRMLDRCDPATFNQFVGPGTCAPVVDETVTFFEFLDQLNPTDFGHDKWAFSAEEIGVRPGERIHVVNRGGEFHTFALVAEYGGGCVKELNEPLGLTPVPECANPDAFQSGAPPKGTVDVTAPTTTGTAHYMCLIHPWMRTDVKVKN